MKQEKKMREKNIFFSPIFFCSFRPFPLAAGPETVS